MSTPAPADSPHTCPECGYNLRGLPPGRACPECGQQFAYVPTRSEAGRAWSRAVAVGLAMLLYVSLDAVASVLIQPFTDTLAGSLPSLNVPGPKLWAVPLLQRPIGRSPALPGVTGTRVAILSLLAVWLITARRPEASGRLA